MFSIVREKEFDEQITNLSRDYSRMYDLDNAIDWVLSRRPNKIPNLIKFPPHYYLWITDEFWKLDIPMLRILFRIDKEKSIVYLLSVQEVPTDEEDLF